MSDTHILFYTKKVWKSGSESGKGRDRNVKCRNVVGMGQIQMGMVWDGQELCGDGDTVASVHKLITLSYLSSSFTRHSTKFN